MRFYWLTIALLVALALALLWSADPTLAAPCEHHRGHAKRVCVRAHRAQVVRDHLRFPPHPTMRDLVHRVPDWFGFVRLGRCEQPGSGRWGVAWGHQGPTYGGGTGIFRSTWYTAGSPYTLWSASIPEEILVADAIRDRFGITAWGAHGCF